MDPALAFGLDEALTILRAHPVGLSGGVTFYTPRRDIAVLHRAAEIAFPMHRVLQDQGLVWVIPPEMDA